MIKDKGKNDVGIIVCVLLLYSLNRFVLKKVVNVPILSYLLKSHFNDWLGGIFIIAYINFVLQHSQYEQIQICAISHAILINALCSIIWEFVGPYIFRYGTSDLLDVLAYIVGGITYILIQHLLTNGKRAA